MISRQGLQQIVQSIHNQQELRGVPVGYYDGSQCRVIDRGNMSNPSGVHGVAIEEITLPVPYQSGLRPNQTRVVNGAAPELRNGSRLAEEAAMAGINCGFTVLAGLVVAGALAAEAPTAGASSLVLFAGWTGLVTSGIQCGNGLARTAAALANPNGHSISRADSNPHYRNGMNIVDGAGILAGGASTARSISRETGRALVRELAAYGTQLYWSSQTGSVQSARSAMGRQAAPVGRLQPSITLHLFQVANSFQ